MLFKNNSIIGLYLSSNTVPNGRHALCLPDFIKHAQILNNCLEDKPRIMTQICQSLVDCTYLHPVDG